MKYDQANVQRDAIAASFRVSRFSYEMRTTPREIPSPVLFHQGDVLFQVATKEYIYKYNIAPITGLLAVSKGYDLQAHARSDGIDALFGASQVSYEMRTILREIPSPDVTV